MDVILNHIYASCDPENTNSVPVCSIMDLVKPYMSDNLPELHELKVELDPQNLNPSVSREELFQAMEKWIAKIEAKFNAQNTEGSHGDDFYYEKNSTSIDCSLAARAKYNKRRAMSTSSILVPTDNQSFEDELKKLKHQLTKTTAELHLVKEQLTASEEQNEILSSDLSTLRKTQLREYQVDLERSKQECDEIEEEALAAKRKIEKLMKTISNFEKNQNTLMEQINELETEKSVLNNKLETMDKKHLVTRRSLEQVQDTVDLKDNEIKDLHDVIAHLEKTLNEKVDLVVFYTNENSFLKEKIENLEITVTGLVGKLNVENALEENTFNTPTLLKQLRNPVSPNLNSPEMNFENCIKSTPTKLESSLINKQLMIYNSATVLRNTHKTLKEELAESSNSNNLEEVKRLQDVIRAQEDIHNILWTDMKSLSNFKESYEELLSTLQEKDDCIDSLKMQLESQKIIPVKEDKSTETSGIKTMENKFTETDLHEYNDQSTETDLLFWNIPLQSCESKKTNYSKQQLKMERLLDKQEMTEKYLATERSINTSLSLKQQELNDKINKLTDDLVLQQLKTREQEELARNVMNENKLLSDKILTLENNNQMLLEKIILLNEEKTKLSAEQVMLWHNYENITQKISVDAILLNNMKEENRLLLTKYEETKLILGEMKQQLVDLHTKNSMTITELHNNLNEKEKRMEDLETKTDIFNKIILSISVANKELKWATLTFYKKLEPLFVDEFTENIPLNRRLKVIEKETENKNTSCSEKERLMLNNNIQFVKLLFDFITEKFGLLQKVQPESELHKEQIIKTIKTEISVHSPSLRTTFFGIENFLENVDHENMSFLDKMLLDDDNLKGLTKQEMEHKIKNLALSLTVDVNTINKRYHNQEDIYNKLILKYFTYLDDSIELFQGFSPNNNESLICLKTLKNLGEEIFTSAVRYGISFYEKRTINCWNLILNYLAILDRENNQKSEIVCGEGPDHDTLQFIDQNQNCQKKPPFKRLNSYKRLGLYFMSLFFIVASLIVLSIFYIDRWCPKDGKRICPSDWFLSLFVKKRYYTHL